MAIFRIQNNVPDVYARKSRDFQLLCNSFDCVVGGVRYDIDSMLDILDTQRCNERLLPYLQTKLGFFSKKYLSAYELRTALTSFYQVVRDKGSEMGIREAIEVFLKVCNATNKSDVRILNLDRSVDKDLAKTRLINNYSITVAIESNTVDTTLLTEILKYVVPAGYELKYSFFTSTAQLSEIVSEDKVDIVILKDYYNDAIVNKKDVDSSHGGRVSSTRVYNGNPPEMLESETSENLIVTEDEGKVTEYSYPESSEDGE